jgi:hypothetical protein
MMFLIPDDFRAFMKQVVAYLDAPLEEGAVGTSAQPLKFVDAEDALQDETGYGGRIDGHDTYKFTYISSDGQHKWQTTLKEAAIRDIADGLLIEVPAERFEIVRTASRNPTGEPLLIWGEYGDDALHVRSEQQLLDALDGLQASSTDSPRLFRMWSATDDQLVAVVRGDDCVLYVVESLDGYATSTGNKARSDAFETLDPDGRPLLVQGCDCISWSLARNALLNFVHRGSLGNEVRTPSALLMMGDINREAALAARAEAPSELKRSSIPRMLTPIPVEVQPDTTVPHEVAPPLRVEEISAWARRLLELLQSRSLIELGPANLDEITYQLCGLLQAHGTEAQHSLETAEWLANEIGAVRGINRVFATGGDLQLALRRSRDQV